MSELDQVWSKMLADTSANAAKAGRDDVVEYLRLRASKDRIRSAGVRWLLTSTIEAAYSAELPNRRFIIEREEPYSFRRGNSNMVGVRLDVRYGVRCLSVEAGWARTPADGVMHGGALAAARFSHFGLPGLTEDLRLVHEESLPHWVDESGTQVGSDEIAGQIEHLIGK
jgi:hypothetical protein